MSLELLQWFLIPTCKLFCGNSLAGSFSWPQLPSSLLNLDTFLIISLRIANFRIEARLGQILLGNMINTPRRRIVKII